MSLASQIRNAIGRARGFGECLRCGGTWDHTQEHLTEYTAGGACFPLCEFCWSDLATPEARLPYYRALVDRWINDNPESASEIEVKYQDIESAVTAGR